MTFSSDKRESYTMLISVIVTTYNWPEALAACLDSLLKQDDLHFEILIAEDGELPANAEIAARYTRNTQIPIRHVRHEDTGFRAGTIRNKAVAVSRGDYLIFLDGDCLVFPNFVTRHRQLAMQGHFVPGNRVLLSQAFTPTVLKEHLPVYLWNGLKLLTLRLSGKLNRLLPLFYLPLGFLRRRQPLKWEKAMTCNLAVWRCDFYQANGFDELYEGWGYEDSDLVIRLIHNGVHRLEGRFGVPVLHLWHKQNPRDKADANYQRLLQRVNDPQCLRAEKGVMEHLPKAAHTTTPTGAAH